MKHFTLVTDIDDVMLDLLPWWCQHLNNKHKTNVQPDDILSWDITGYFVGLTKEQVYEPVYKDSFWKTIQPIDGALLTMNKIIDEGHRIIPTSATSYKTMNAKITRFLELFPMFDWNDVIITSQKHLIKCDGRIDDGQHNLINHNSNEFKILYHKAHNKLYNNESDGIVRLYNWNEIHWYINSIANQ